MSSPDVSDRAQAVRQAAPLSRLTRRGFLRYGLIGSAALAAAAAGGFAILRRSPVDSLPVAEGIRNLSAGEHHLFRRAIEVLLPTAGTALTPVEDVPVLANIDHMMGLLPAHVRTELGTGLALFDNAAVVSGLHGRRFVDLDDQAAVAYFDAWSRGHSIQRALNTVIKQFVYTAYWREPVTWPPVEFDGPVSDDWGLDYLGNAPLPREDRPS